MTGRIKAHYAELLAEPLQEMPDALDTAAFERWALKLTLHFLEGLNAQQKAKIRKNNPLFLLPDQLALDFKDRILKHLHKAYVSETEARGYERMFHGGTYCFRQPVPAEKIIEACQKADLIK